MITFIFTHVYNHVYTSLMNDYTHVYTHVYSHVSKPVYTHVYTHVYTFMFKLIFTFLCLNMYVHTHVYTHFLHCSHTCLKQITHIFILMFTHVYTFLHTCLNTCFHIMDIRACLWMKSSQPSAHICACFSQKHLKISFYEVCNRNGPLQIDFNQRATNRLWVCLFKSKFKSILSLDQGDQKCLQPVVDGGSWVANAD
jgi:hypothetical protein